jgi:hypothetical protein
MNTVYRKSMGAPGTMEDRPIHMDDLPASVVETGPWWRERPRERV